MLLRDCQDAGRRFRERWCHLRVRRIIDPILPVTSMTLAHDDVFPFLETHVWPCPYRTAYIEEGVLREWMLQRGDASRFVDLVAGFLPRSHDVTRLGCDAFVLLRHYLLLETIPVSVQTRLCGLLQSFVCLEATRNLVLDEDLFRRLSARHTIRVPFLKVVVHGRVVEIDHVFDLARSVCVSLVTHRDDDEGLGLTFVASLARLDEWVPILVPWVVRSSWPPSFGPLVHALVHGTSVLFLLSLDRATRLDVLVRAGDQHTSTSPLWGESMVRLRSLWPSRVRGGGGGSDGPPSASSTAVCPITHCECVRPVTASDGRTYECDALLTYLSMYGMVSPVTKQTLSYHLFDNYDNRY